RLLESSCGVTGIGKCLGDGLGLGNQLRVERRSHHITAFLRLFEVQHQLAIAYRVALAHEQLLMGLESATDLQASSVPCSIRVPSVALFLPRRLLLGVAQVTVVHALTRNRI